MRNIERSSDMLHALLRNKVFIIVTIADLIQQLGIWIRNMALLFYVMDLTENDPVAVSLLTVLEYLPILLFSLIGGALADRWEPKRTMIMGDLLSAVSIAGIVLSMQAGYGKTIFAAVFISAVITQFSWPSSSVMFKRHIPEQQVTTAISISAALASLFVIIGPIIGTLIFTWLGIYASLTVLVILFLCSAAMQTALPKVSQRTSYAAVTLSHQFKKSYSYLLNNKNLRALVVGLTLLELGLGLIQPLEVYIVMDRLGLEKEAIQWLYGLYGIGMFAGGVLSARMIHKIQATNSTSAGFCVLALLIISEALSIWFLFTGSIRFMAGIVAAFLQVVIEAFLIRFTAERYIGIINGTISTLVVTGTLLGSSMAGVLMKHTSLLFVYCLASGIVFAAGIYCRKLELNNK
ncbi:MFS transporter [Pectinatus haikarae]|uniref:MFS transporter n=1 Tax=Pectinatus haikarae TaxID=349096 RepID=UPI0018C4BD92|nr:MFS transporter [Pectinatus haikarae]